MSLNASISAIGLRWLRIAVVYLMIGIALGIYMGAAEVFTLAPVHAHINLVGFVVAALAGIVYCLSPAAGASRLGSAHFWLHQIGSPLMLVSLALVLGNGESAAIPTLVVGEFLVAGGVVCFFLNLLLNIKPSDG